ncbi:MAG: UPF0158 family protein [Chitinophagales bacterium]
MEQELEILTAQGQLLFSIEVALALRSNNVKHFLDLEKRIVISFSESDELVDDYWDEIEAHPEQYLQIEPIGMKDLLQAKQDFVKMVNDATLQAALIQSLESDRLEVAFRQALHPYPEVLKNWYFFEDVFYLQKAKDWLLENGVMEP